MAVCYTPLFHDVPSPEWVLVFAMSSIDVRSHGSQPSRYADRSSGPELA